MKKILKRVQAFVIVISMGLMSTNAYAEEMPISNGQVVSADEHVGCEQNQELFEMIKNVPSDVSVYEAEEYKIISTLSNSWEGGFNADIVIENTGDRDIRNWYITFPAQYEISNIWNATILSRENGEYLIKNVDWNGTISSGNCVQFGITVNEKFTGFPSVYEVVGTYAEESDDNYTIIYSADNVWDAGFTGNIVINNISNKVIEDWVLEFDCENKFTNIWNAILVSQEGDHYVLQNAEHNGDINPGESVTIGFVVNEGNLEKKPSKFTLNSFVLRQEPEVEEQEKELLKDLTESYIKPAMEEDILFDEDEGIYYVKNQIMVGAYLGTPKSAMEKLAEYIGAEIVGYVALIEDYQLEFKKEMTYSELMKTVEYLEGIPYVDYAELNLATPSVVQYFTNDTLYNCGELWVTTDADSNNDGKYDDVEKVNTKKSGADDGWKQHIADGNNWGLEALNVHSAWDYKDSYQGPVKVGIFDNMFGENPDLYYCQCIDNPKVIDEIHGTHVTGTIGATFDNGVGISGVATDVNLYGYAKADTSASDGKIFSKLIENNVRVINVSYGYYDEVVYAASVPDATGDKARKMIEREADSLSRKLKKLVVQGYDFLIVCSAGNGNGKQYVKDSGAKYGYAIYDSIDYPNEQPIIGNPNPFYNYKLTAINDEIVSSRIMVVGAVGHLWKSYGTEFFVAPYSLEGNRVDVYAPGVDILSTVPQIGFSDSYMTLSGTSMAAPHISGLAALILQANPELTSLQVKDIIKRNNGAQIGTTGKYMPDAEKCVVEALSKPGGGFDTVLPQGLLKGKAMNSEGEVLEGLAVLLVRTSTGQSNLGDYYFNAETKKDGTFEIELPQGTYEMIIYGETLSGARVMPFKTGNIEIEPETEKYLETSVLFMSFSDEMREMCNISGTVYDALSGNPIEGAKVNARAGWNTFNGPYVTGMFDSIKEDSSDANGEFDIKAVQSGQYTVEIKKDGYVIGYYNMVSQLESDEARQAVILTPELSDDEYRAVLTWGAVPRDLDSHLTYYEGSTQKMHVYYGAKIGMVDGVKVAELDLDDTNGYGPETVTLTFRQDKFGDDERYIYSVHDFSNGSDSASTALSQSGAIVRLYCGNSIAETFYVPANKAGTVWQVFQMSKKGVKSLNSFYSASASEVR